MRLKRKLKRGKRQLLRAVQGGPFGMRRRSDPATSPLASSAELGEAAPRGSSAGILRFDDQQARLPESLAEAGEAEDEGMMPARVVIVITTLAIAFIAIITWFVSRMPQK